VLPAQICLYAVWRGNRQWWLFAVWGLLIGLAGLTKGPYVLAILATTAIAMWLLSPSPVGGGSGWGPWNRRQNQDNDTAQGPLLSPPPEGEGAPSWLHWTIRVILVLAGIAAVIAPWLIAMERRIPGYTINTIWSEVIVRAGKPQEGHSGPPGYYLLTIWGTYFPWSLLLPLSLVYAWRHRRIPQIRFALAAVVGPWVVMEIVQTKLPHYLLPVYPFLAFLSADALVRCIRRGRGDLHDRPWDIATCVWAIIVTLLGTAPWLSIFFYDITSPWTIAGLALLTLSAVVCGWGTHHFFARRRPARAAACMGVSFAAFVAVAYGIYLPHASFLRLGEETGERLRSYGATEPGEVVMVDFKEPSVAFYQGGTIREADEGFWLTTPRADWPAWMVLTRDAWARTPAEFKDQWDVTETLHGLAYADGGRDVLVMIVRKRPETSPNPR
jgi:4-amino-4-deoxy-L-arabinose transferase-like glycosyltransferase